MAPSLLCPPEQDGADDFRLLRLVCQKAAHSSRLEWIIPESRRPVRQRVGKAPARTRFPLPPGGTACTDPPSFQESPPPACTRRRPAARACTRPRVCGPGAAPGVPLYIRGQFRLTAEHGHPFGHRGRRQQGPVPQISLDLRKEPGGSERPPPHHHEIAAGLFVKVRSRLRSRDIPVSNNRDMQRRLDLADNVPVHRGAYIWSRVRPWTVTAAAPPASQARATSTALTCSRA